MTPCSFFAAGRCRNGRDCKFFHAARDDVAMIPPLCKFFLLGTCTDGGECKFLHTAPAQGSALRVNTKTGEKILEPGFYGISCKFFKYGNCCNGNNCPYLHSEEEGRLENKAEVATDGPRTLQSQIDKVEKKGSHTADMSGGGHGVDYNGEEEATELRDFITKEEELYYYGDPSDLKGAIAESKPSMTKESYGEAAKKDQKHEIMPFYEQRPTPPYVLNC
ncbi:putative Zinc finger, CCCH-type [Plasmopara halstedii]